MSIIESYVVAPESTNKFQFRNAKYLVTVFVFPSVRSCCAKRNWFQKMMGTMVVKKSCVNRKGSCVNRKGSCKPGGGGTRGARGLRDRGTRGRLGDQGTEGQGDQGTSRTLGHSTSCLKGTVADIWWCLRCLRVYKMTKTTGTNTFILTRYI